MDLPTILSRGEPLIAAELRPPRAELGPAAGMEAWIDTYHAVRGLARLGTFTFLTDGAVGAHEEDNLRHLVANLGGDVPRERIVPFLTTKHTLDYCLDYADRAWDAGFRSLVVLGGDSTVGPPRVVPHGSDLRRLIRARQTGLALGGWANPHAAADTQVGYLLESGICADFFLTQIVSHHDAAAVERFLGEAARRQLALSPVFGCFYYRSANRRTLRLLSRFLSVPTAALSEEFAAGGSAVEICSRSIATLRRVGVQHLYLSNLPTGAAATTLAAILRRAEELGA